MHGTVAALCRPDPAPLISLFRHLARSSRAGANPSQETLLKAAQFLREELPVRLAHRVVELDSLPGRLSEMPAIHKVKGWYALSFEELTSLPKPRDMVGTVPERPTSSHMAAAAAHSSPAGHARPSWPSNIADANAAFVQVLEKIKRRHDPVTTQIGTEARDASSGEGRAIGRGPRRGSGQGTGRGTRDRTRNGARDAR